MPGPSLSPQEIETFVRDGAVPLRAAFPAAVAAECREILWRATGCVEDDPSTWTHPVIRIDARADAPFVAAATVLPGVRIGHDSVVGAGAVVAKDVPPLTVVTGSGQVVRKLLADPAGVDT